MRPLLALLALAACGETRPTVPGTYEPRGEVVLTVGGQPLHRDAVDLALSRIPAPQREAIAEQGQLQPMVEKMALGEALYHRAVEQGLHDDPEVRLRLAMAQRDALAQALIDRVVNEAATEERLRQAYEERKVQFTQPSADVAMILLADEASARDVWSRLQAGAPFEQLAREHSIDRGTGEQGGALGWVVKGQLAEPVDDAVFATQGTGPQPPVAIGGRWFIADVRSRRDVVPFEDVRDQLELQVQQEVAERYLDELEQQLAIEWRIAPERLAVPDAPSPAPAVPSPASPPAPEGAQGG